MRENLAEASAKASVQLCPIYLCHPESYSATALRPGTQGLHFLLFCCLPCLTNSYTYSTVQFKSEHICNIF